MMMTEKTINVPESEVPEIVELEEASKKVKRFMAKHRVLMAELSGLVFQYNRALDAATKAVNAKAHDADAGVNCGPFVFKYFRRSYNADMLFDLVGKAEFKKLGCEVVPSYQVIDKAKLQRNMESGRVPKSVVEAVMKKTAVFEKPEKVVLP
jgi:hypothetical protein